MEILNAYINPVTLGLCLVVGYILKHWIKDVNDKIIPTVVAVLGVVISVAASGWVFTPENILNSAISGLASTGLHQLFKQWIDAGGKHEKE